jgi:hypothetical protein
MADKTRTLIKDITHPNYDAKVDDWEKWRVCYEGGSGFVTDGLHILSSRETITEFNERLNLTYPPAHAKAAVNRVKNAIIERLPDVTRHDGPDTYQKAVAGDGIYVDKDGNDMDGFISRAVLPELLPMGKVGIFVDRSPIMEGATAADTASNHPYVYVYKAEDIRSWTYDSNKVLTSVLLRTDVDVYDEEYGLVSGTAEEYILMNKVVEIETGKPVIQVRRFDADGEEIGLSFMNIPEIPLVILEISHSLMTDIADHQISLLNMASLDVAFLIKANFPFYTEQSGLQEMASFMNAQQSPASGSEDYPGTGVAAKVANTREIKVGVTKGRRYGHNLERPAFIHPSSEPLKASMEKEQQIKDEINELLNLTIQTLHQTRASAESKQADDRGMISGLSAIGKELEYGEIQIMRIWAMYEGSKPDATIKYPLKYTMQTEAERLAEADKLKALLPTLPSREFQLRVAYNIAMVMLGHKVSETTLEKIRQELDDSKVIAIDPEVIRDDVESMILSRETASAARGYPKGEVEKANKEHAERAARIAKAQESRTRGVDDTDPNPAQNNSEEKEASRDTTMEDSTADRTRGDAK